MFVELSKLPGYLIHDTGEIVSLRRGKWYTISPVENHGGYLRANLTTANGTKKIFSVHRLVMEAFAGARPAEITVNHIDGNKTNNALSNLEYLTVGANNQHSYDAGLRPLGEKHSRAKFPDVVIVEIRRLKGAMKAKEVAEKFGIDRRYVLDLWENKTRKTAGIATPCSQHTD